MAFHNIRDENGRFAPASKVRGKKKTTKRKSKAKKKVEDDRIQVDICGIVADVSGSMYGFSGGRGPIDVANDMVFERTQQIRSNAINNKTTAYITVTPFSSNVDFAMQNAYHESEDVRRRINLKNYYAGMTALHDATVETMLVMERKHNELRNDPEFHRMDIAFLLYVLTDGHENNSRLYVNKMGNHIKKRQRTDRWTIGFMCPPESVERIKRDGIPVGNIQAWDGSVAEAETNVRRGTQVATQSYFATRSAGGTSTQSLFVNLGDVTTKDVEQCGDDVSKRFHTWRVDKESDISGFVNDKLENANVCKIVGDNQYTVGRAYYQLTKSEKVQHYKDVLVLDRDTKKLVSGPDAKKLIGITDSNADVRLKPHDLSTFTIFVQSTSGNRKLVRGTDLKYEKVK